MGLACHNILDMIYIVVPSPQYTFTSFVGVKLLGPTEIAHQQFKLLLL